MKSFQRIDRIGELMHRELAQIIQLKMRDPRIGLVNVNKVKVARDLSIARVYVSTLGEEPDNLYMVEVLNKAGSFLRTELAKKIQVRVMPILRFIFDDTQLRGNRIDLLLNQIDVQDDPGPSEQED